MYPPGRDILPGIHFPEKEPMETAGWICFGTLVTGAAAWFFCQSRGEDAEECARSAPVVDDPTSS